MINGAVLFYTLVMIVGSYLLVGLVTLLLIVIDETKKNRKRRKRK